VIEVFTSEVAKQMEQKKPERPEEPGFSISGQSDTFTAGDAMLARAKCISQRIMDRVRALTQETHPGVPDEATDEHRPLAD
jgi:hypothetical protein